jgi:hypothetical protein
MLDRNLKFAVNRLIPLLAAALARLSLGQP